MEEKEEFMQTEESTSSKKKKKQKKKMKRWKRILLWILIPVIILTAVQITYNCVVDFIFYKATEALLKSPDTTESVELKENTSVETGLPAEEGEDSPTQDGKKTPDILDAAAKKHNVTAKLSFTPEQVKKLNEKISRADKLAVLAIIARAIPQEAYNTLLSMTSGGITRAEISRAYSILSKNLSTEDKNAIYSYYLKYVHLLDE